MFIPAHCAPVMTKVEIGIFNTGTKYVKKSHISQLLGCVFSDITTKMLCAKVKATQCVVDNCSGVFTNFVNDMLKQLVKFLICRLIIMNCEDVTYLKSLSHVHILSCQNYLAKQPSEICSISIEKL